MYVRRIKDMGALIRDRRKAKGWTQARLADELDLPRRTIGRLETAAHASRLDLVLAALNALDVSLWADTGNGAPVPDAAPRQGGKDDDVDLAAVINDMLDEL